MNIIEEIMNNKNKYNIIGFMIQHPRIKVDYSLKDNNALKFFNEKTESLPERAYEKGYNFELGSNTLKIFGPDNWVERAQINKGVRFYEPVYKLKQKSSYVSSKTILVKDNVSLMFEGRLLLEYELEINNLNIEKFFQELKKEVDKRDKNLWDSFKIKTNGEVCRINGAVKLDLDNKLMD